MGWLLERARALALVAGFGLFLLLRKNSGDPLWLRGARRLRLAPRVEGRYTGPPAIPRVIWAYWNNGEETAPPLARRCLESWRRLNPGWELRVLSDATLGDWVDTADVAGRVSVQMHSDMLRLRLLSRHGGVWVDASLLCTAPLDDWLPEAARSGFFAFFRPPGATPERLASSWFLASEPGNRLTVAWERAMTRYWTVMSRSVHYFLIHLIFEYLIRTDHRLRRIWNPTPKISSDFAHLLQYRLAGHPEPWIAPMARAAVEGGFPVQKLNLRDETADAQLDAIVGPPAWRESPPETHART